MEILKKGTILEVSDDEKNKLLEEYGAFFEMNGQNIVVSNDNMIRMNDDRTLSFKKTSGDWEQILLTDEQEQVVEEDNEEEEDIEDVDTEADTEDEVEEDLPNNGILGRIRQRTEKIWQRRYERQYGYSDGNTEPKKKSDKILTGSDLNNFISHIGHKSGINIINEYNIEGLNAFREDYVSRINGYTLELYWNNDDENPREKFKLGTKNGISKLLDYQYQYSNIPENQRDEKGIVDLVSASQNGSLRKSSHRHTITKFFSDHRPGHKKPEQILKYVAYAAIADNLTKILNFTKRDCHTSRGMEFVNKIKNVWIPFLQADQSVSKLARRENFIEGLNLFVQKVEAEQAKQYEEDIDNDSYYDNEQKNMNNKYAQRGLLDPQRIFNLE